MKQPTIKTMIEWVRQDVKELREDIKLLQSFRMRVIGIATATAAIVSLAAGVLL